MKIIKKLLLVLGVFSTLFVVIGFFLPREWSVKVQATASATQKERIFSQISQFKNWDNWAVWKSLDESYQSEFSETDGEPGSWMKWQGQKTGRGQLTFTQIEPMAFVRYDGAIESTEKNAEGEIRIDNSENDQVVVVWEDKGELPPIVGGYFKSMIEKSLSEHFQTSLDRLVEAKE